MHFLCGNAGGGKGVKVIKTVDCDESLKYTDCWDMDLPPDERTQLYNEADECVSVYCKINNIRLSGIEYQYGGANIPILEHNGKEYALLDSMRSWGTRMYDLWGDGSGSGERADKMGYCKWAWSNPDEISRVDGKDEVEGRGAADEKK
jgi:hypothetical protein